MIYSAAILFFLLTALVQASAMPYFSPLGATPNILLIVSACWIAVSGQRQAMTLLPIGAIFYDLLTANPTGSSLIGIAPLLLLSGKQDDDPSTVRLLPAFVMVSAGTLVYHISDGLIMTALGQEVPWLRALTERWLPEMLVNAVITPIIFLPLLWISLTFQRRNASISWNT